MPIPSLCNEFTNNSTVENMYKKTIVYSTKPISFHANATLEQTKCQNEDNMP